MESWLKHWGIALFLGGVYFSVAALSKEEGSSTCEWGAAGACYAIALYQYMTGRCQAKWEDLQRDLPREAAGKSRPKDPIGAIIQTVIRKIRHQP